MGTQLKWATPHDFRVVLSVLCCHTGSHGEFTSFIRYSQIVNSSYALNSNFQTTSYMGLHRGTEGSQKKRKAKQNKKTEKRKKERKKPIKAENSRILLKTIPNENKYKTKLKKCALPDTNCFLADNIYLWKLSADYLLYPHQVLRLPGAEAN